MPAKNREDGNAITHGWQIAISYDDLARLAIVVVLGLVLLTFRDYGITNDEEVQKVYGEMILAYYSSGFHDLSALTYKDLYFYGGAFDLVAALLNKISPLGTYETRHLLGGMIGVFGLLGAWRLGKLLGGQRAGFLTVVLLALMPAYYGPAFNNPKDVPFAVGMLWTLLTMCQLIPELPNPPLGRVMAFAVSLGLTLGVRVGAGLAGIYLLVGSALYLFWRAAETRSLAVAVADARSMMIAFWPAVPVAYLTMALLWPWAYQAPLNPLVAVAHFAHYGINIDTLMAGNWLPAGHLPAIYLPLYLLMKLPELTLAGAAMALGLVTRWLWSRSRRRDLGDKGRCLQFVLIGLAAAFPILFFIIERPTIYNGIRHFEFLLPPSAVIAAFGLDRLWSLLGRHSENRSRAFGLVLGTAVAIQVWIMASLHPDEYVYYNLLAGGVSGAAGHYELDYWGNSLAEAARDLTHYVAMENGGRPVHHVYRVAICGNSLAATYFMPPFLRFTAKPAEADFFVAFTQHDCDRVINGREIIAVERFGAPLSVVKDLRTPGRGQTALATSPPPVN